MPRKSTIERARKDAREGKAATTQAGAFVHEEMEHIRQGKHGARSSKQAIAIGLSKARRAGVKLAPPKAGASSASTRKQAQRDLQKGQQPNKPGRPSPKRSRATQQALKREGRAAASPRALSQQARTAAARRRRAGGATEGVSKPGTARSSARRTRATKRTRARG